LCENIPHTSVLRWWSSPWWPVLLPLLTLGMEATEVTEDTEDTEDMEDTDTEDMARGRLRPHL